MAILEAASAIAAGMCQAVVVANAQAGAYTVRPSTAPWTRPSNEFVECWGLYTAAEFAPIAQRHMHLYDTKPEHLAEVASTIRTNGGQNPNAVYSGQVVTPVHLLDCAMTAEGGAGLVLTTVERARDLDVPMVRILGGGLDRRGPGYQMAPVWDRVGDVGGWAAQKAFEMSGLEPSDVDVCEFYDPFSFEIIRQFEAYGFCEVGEGGPFVMDGHPPRRRVPDRHGRRHDVLLPRGDGAAAATHRLRGAAAAWGGGQPPGPRRRGSDGDKPRRRRALRRRRAAWRQVIADEQLGHSAATSSRIQTSRAVSCSRQSVAPLGGATGLAPPALALAPQRRGAP